MLLPEDEVCVRSALVVSVLVMPGASCNKMNSKFRVKKKSGFRRMSKFSAQQVKDVVAVVALSLNLCFILLEPNFWALG